MPIDFTVKLVETASKIATTRNEYGDVVYGATTSSPCLYRDINELNFNSNRELENINGILWLGPDESVILGDVYYIDGPGYVRIEEITLGKRLLTGDETIFKKCLVTKIRQVS